MTQPTATQPTTIHATPTQPTGLDGLTPDWLTAALGQAFPGITVTEANLAGVLHGTAAKARLEVTAEGAENVPSSFLVKGSFTQNLGDDDLAQAWDRLIAMLNQTEAGFYQHSSPLLGDRCPRCYYAAATEHSSVLILEDLNNRDGIEFGAYDAPLGPDGMAEVLDSLATLHAARWNDPDLAANPLRDGFVEGGMLDGFLSEINWNQQLTRPRAKVLPDELTDHQHVTTAIRRAWAAKRTGPASLIHGDPHLGNYFYDHDGAGLLDFQLFTSGHWASDVVYAIASAMDTDTRRNHERDLLRHYLDRINSLTGHNAPRLDQAWHDYRKFAIWGFCLLLTPGEGIQAEQFITTMGQRHAQAALDLDSINLINAQGA